MTPFSPRFVHQIEHLHRLGPRPVGELFIEIVTAASNPGFAAFAAERLDRYAALDPVVVREVGGDQFPSNPLRLVKS